MLHILLCKCLVNFQELPAAAVLALYVQMMILSLVAEGSQSAGGTEDEEVPDWGQENSGKTPLKLGKVHL